MGSIEITVYSIIIIYISVRQGDSNRICDILSDTISEEELYEEVMADPTLELTSRDCETDDFRFLTLKPIQKYIIILLGVTPEPAAEYIPYGETPFVSRLDDATIGVRISLKNVRDYEMSFALTYGNLETKTIESLGGGEDMSFFYDLTVDQFAAMSIKVDPSDPDNYNITVTVLICTVINKSAKKIVSEKCKATWTNTSHGCSCPVQREDITNFGASLLLVLGTFICILIIVLHMKTLKLQDDEDEDAGRKVLLVLCSREKVSSLQLVVS